MQHTSFRARVAAFALATIVLGVGAAGGGAAVSVVSGGGSLTSGTYRVVAESGGTSYVGRWVLEVHGGVVAGTSYWTCCPGARVDPLSGTTADGKIKITRDCRGQGQTACIRQTFSGTIDASGKVTGNWFGNGGYSGTWTMTAKATPGLTVTVSGPAGWHAVEVGEVFNVFVKVTAHGTDFKDVFLTDGGLVVSPACFKSKRTSSGHSVIVTHAPPLASGFPLPAGTSRTFVFKARGHSAGPATLTARVRGETDAGDIARASDAAVVSVSADAGLNRGGKTPAGTSARLCTSARTP